VKDYSSSVMDYSSPVGVVVVISFGVAGLGVGDDSDDAALVERYVYAVASIAVMPSAAVVATAQARHIQRR
jgi:hypothetical protein